MFSRQELFEYFAEFSQEQVLNTIATLAKDDSSINPDAEEFASALVERLKAVLTGTPTKKDKHKQLAPINKTLAAEIKDGEEVISRPELLKYFDKYEPAQIDQALTKLGQDPQQAYYPIAVADKMERAFTLIESALTKQQEAGLTGDLSQLQDLAFDMASEQADIPQQIFAELIEVVTGRAIIQGAVLGKLSNLITEQVYQDTTAEHLAKTIDRTGADIAALYEILQDPHKREQILHQYGFKTREEIQAQVIVQVTSSKEDSFNADEYLTEVRAKKFGMGINSQKQTPWSPKTSKDIQKMTTTILKQCMK